MLPPEKERIPSMCDFVFRPDMWENEVHTIDGPWECPYPSLSNFDFCIFHINPLVRNHLFGSERQIQFEYMKAVRSTGVVHIICSTINDIDLASLSDLTYRSDQIQIGFSTVLGSLNVSSTKIEGDVFIEDCRVDEIISEDSIYESELTIRRSKIESLRLSESNLNGKTRFVDTTFGTAEFINTEFERAVSFCEGIPDPTPISEVDEIIGEGSCVFKETPAFMGTQFSSGAIFADVEFRQGANFHHSNFKSGCTFEQADFNIGCHFGFAEFNEETAFRNADMGTSNFEKTHFRGPVVFDKASFGSGNDHSKRNNIQNHALAEGISEANVESASNVLGDLVFDDGIVSVSGTAASFDNTTAEDLMSIKGAQSVDVITAFHSSFEFLDLNIKFESSSPTISFYGSDIESGTIRISEESSYYEWVKATIGDVMVISNIDNNPFENIYIENTRFDGFDFSDYRKELRDLNWTIDGYYHDGEHRPSDDQEGTYAKAKTGAEEVGDNYSESKFFIKEQRCRGNEYKSQISSPNGPKDLLKNTVNYSLNRIYDILCLYAESSRRVFSWSIALTFGFAAIYQKIGVDLPYESSSTVFSSGFVPDYIGSIDLPLLDVKYIIFSLESFSAFLVGGGPEITDITIRLLASLQSFIGAFLIGLFVATFVRTVKR